MSITLLKSTKVLAAICILFINIGCAYSKQSESAEEFGRRLRQIIIEGDVGSFRQLQCVPQKCIGEDDIRYVFGDIAKPSPIKALLSDPKITIKVFGPYTYEDDYPNGSYALLFYLPEAALFTESGFMTPEARKTQWLRSYTETVISKKNGDWIFHRTPFYFGAHLPWLADY